MDEDERGDAFWVIPKLRLLVVLGLYWGAMGIPKLGLLPLLIVEERSNFKKIPTHTQDHGDA